MLMICCWCFTEKKVNMNDILLEQLTKYYPKIKLKMELNPNKFMDTKSICVNGIYNTMVNRKSTKSKIAWLSKVSKCYKRNAIIDHIDYIVYIDWKKMSMGLLMKLDISKLNF